jgi:hypothetical protein
MLIKPDTLSLDEFDNGKKGGMPMQFETLATGYGLLEGPRTDDQNRL